MASSPPEETASLPLEGKGAGAVFAADAVLSSQVTFVSEAADSPEAAAAAGAAVAVDVQAAAQRSGERWGELAGTCGLGVSCGWVEAVP